MANEAPIGTELTPSSASSPAPGSATPAAAAEPHVFDLSDENALIKVKGSEKPVKFGEHVRGFQSQFTKASQKAAQLEKDLAQERALRQRHEQALNQRQSGGPQGQSPDVFEALRALPYLTGEDAVTVVQSIAQQIQQRDQILLGALRQMQQMQGIVKGLHESSTGSSFDAKISKWLQDGGYPAEAADLAKEIYLAYEGDDLDTEFPQIFANRWKQIETLLDGRRAAKIQANKKMPFLPGKGGQANPSKPLEIKPNATAREVADELWNAGWGSET